MAEWLSNGRRLATPAAEADLSVNELFLAYLRHADGYYVKNGKPTVEPGNIRLAGRPLRQLYGQTPAREFGPVALKAVRGAMAEADICRSEINRRIGRIVRVFKWAVSEEMVPPSVHQALQTVPGLRRGRADVRESEPVRPVPDAFVDAIEPYVSRQVWALVELQRLTGMRPGEACVMRTADIDTSGKVWVYTPERHKTEHHGRERRIYLGPAAQAILRPWLRTELTAYLFSPAEATAERQAAMRERRRTRVQPSQRNRGKARPEKEPGEVYTTESYRRAIAYGVKRANADRAKRGESEVPSWHPHQLRHSAATRLRKEFGLDVARAVLGHSFPVVTELYAKLDGTKAAEAMGRIGRWNRDSDERQARIACSR
ncbi:tyrosine-type recombinase/integrase [Paludisphaera soli]|uniref:tyrosine-type recombinase/integrase n=1 Tax=Paludisphaera soli TaxID=2712865 RepID=UPI001F108714|nr:site-specific integrase [Paludisphaera soli]